jgi:hypothetical protein
MEEMYSKEHMLKFCGEWEDVVRVLHHVWRRKEDRIHGEDESVT